MSTLNVESISHPTSGSNVTINGVTPAGTNQLGNRNLIINGAMQVDQRNAGASVDASNTGGNTYVLDRWHYRVLAASKFTIQQNAGSVTPPAGYTNYLGCTSSSAYTVGASELLTISQRIEGFNIANLAWGTASAKTVTLSFQVYSSLTGTFGGAIRNSAGNRSYPFSFDISSTNTWTPVSITIPGDTTGTWLTNNGTGIDVRFSLGTGSNYSQSAGSWYAGSAVSATGATSVVGTNGATFYITGVQLEVGSVATPFEHRSYGDELLRCQRYFLRLVDATTGVDGGFLNCANYTSVNAYGALMFPTTMRTGPSLSYDSSNMQYFSNGGNDSSITLALGGSGVTHCEFIVGNFAMTAGHAGWVRINNTGYVSFSAEL